MPLKRAVLGLLDDAEPLVDQVGAANTVVFDAGLRRGHNTDVPGMIAALAELGLTSPSPVLILGAGATACSALAAVRGLGVAAATVAARDERRAGGLLAVAERLGMTVRLVPFDEPGEPAPGLLISTTPARAADRHAARIRQGALAPGCLLDVVYHPWPTALAAAAQQADVPVASGFALLLHQAARQVELMTGKPAPVGAMRAAGLAAFATKR
jgi:shikimate dehydrogenase